MTGFEVGVPGCSVPGNAHDDTPIWHHAKETSPFSLPTLFYPAVHLKFQPRRKILLGLYYRLHPGRPVLAGTSLSLRKNAHTRYELYHKEHIGQGQECTSIALHPITRPTKPYSIQTPLSHTPSHQGPSWSDIPTPSHRPSYIMYIYIYIYTRRLQHKCSPSFPSSPTNDQKRIQTQTLSSLTLPILQRRISPLLFSSVPCDLRQLHTFLPLCLSLSLSLPLSLSPSPLLLARSLIPTYDRNKHRNPLSHYVQRHQELLHLRAVSGSRPTFHQHVHGWRWRPTMFPRTAREIHSPAGHVSPMPPLMNELHVGGGGDPRNCNKTSGSSNAEPTIGG